jgi:DNA-binding PadR family transcriptional regulator
VEKSLDTLASDKIIHERARLLILTFLASSEDKAVAFGTIRDALGFTPGNLSVQLKTLADAGYIAITKEFRDNKPLTQAAMTQKGSAALKRYLEDMENLVKRLKTK